MDLVCDWFGPFRRLDINSCEVRYPEDKFECRDGDSYDRRADLFLDHGVRRRLTINDRLDRWTDISFPDSVGLRDRCVLALLFSCPADRKHQQGRADR